MIINIILYFIINKRLIKRLKDYINTYDLDFTIQNLSFENKAETICYIVII